MPNIITHVLFADDVCEKIEKDKQDLFNSRLQLFEIGSNGPDFLFFQGFNLKELHKKHPLRKLGGECHSHSINDFYLSCLNSINRENDDEIRKDMIAYVCGHLCHWALDSTAHPYVFYRTGNCKGKSAWWHHRFESLLDAIMLKVKNECTIKDFKAYEICQVSLEQARAIARIYIPVLDNVYGAKVKPHEILNCLNDWCFVEKVLYDASGRKYNATHLLERLVLSESMISGYFVPNEPDDPFDVTNLLHKRWCHPCDEKIVSTESFFDLYDKAILKALDVIRLFTLACEDEKAVPDFIHYLANQSYDTGLSEQKEMKYFDLVY